MLKAKAIVAGKYHIFKVYVTVIINRILLEDVFNLYERT